MLKFPKFGIQSDIALLIVRVIIGGIFITTGWMKISDMATTLSFFGGIGIPVFLTYLVSYGELVGGILLVLGICAEAVSLFLTIVMITAVYLTASAGFQVFITPLATLAGAVAILGSGAGRYRIKIFERWFKDVRHP